MVWIPSKSTHSKLSSKFLSHKSVYIDASVIRDWVPSQAGFEGMA
jgi:hypothetical protein